MKISIHKEYKLRAFTRAELFMVLFMVFAFVFLIYSALILTKTTSKAQRCQANLRSVAYAFHRFYRQSRPDYSFRYSTNESGTQEYIKGADSYQHFRVLTNELEHPRLLVCPSDARKPAVSIQSVTNENLSYFLNLDASPVLPNAFLSGDRLLIGNPQRMEGLLIPGGNGCFQWNSNLHNRTSQQPEGNIVMSDGSVSQLTSQELTKQFTNRHNSKNRFLFPE